MARSPTLPERAMFMEPEYLRSVSVVKIRFSTNGSYEGGYHQGDDDTLEHVEEHVKVVEALATSLLRGHCRHGLLRYSSQSRLTFSECVHVVLSC